MSWRRSAISSAVVQVAVVSGVVSRDLLEIAAFGEFLERVGPRRLEQPVSGDRARGLHDHEGLRGQVRDAVHDLRCAEVGGGRHRARRLQREAADEDGQAPQDGALDGGKQLVAPVERRTQRLMPRQRGAVAAGEQPEPVVEMGGELFQPERGGAGRRQLDGERDAVEATTDRAGDRRGARVQREVQLYRLGPRHEQLDRGRARRDRSGRSGPATRRATRVLPWLPARISGTSRWTPSSSVTSVSAAARPISSEVGAGRFVGDGASGSAATAADRRSAAGPGAGSPPTGPATVARSGRLDRERRISWYSWLVSASGDVRSSRFSASTQSWYWRSAASRRPRRA